MNPGNKSNLPAFLLSILLALLVMGSLLYILQDRYRHHNVSPDEGYRIADIYKDGLLYQRINLDQVVDEYTFEIIDSNGHWNKIAVNCGSIGILSADCPDKLCVHQGFISSSLLPITCLPNRLVIRVHIEKANDSVESFQPDAITY